MATSIIRATFGRLSGESLARITIGHIEIGGVEVDTITGDIWRRRRQGRGSKYDNIKLEPYVDRYRIRAVKEDNELIELVVAMVESKLI